MLESKHRTSASTSIINHRLNPSDEMIIECHCYSLTDPQLFVYAAQGFGYVCPCSYIAEQFQGPLSWE